MTTKKRFSVPRVVRFTYTDPAGYVFFPRYFEMLQAVVEDWFTFALATNYADQINNDDILWPTARTECVFQKPCKLGEVLDLTVVLERIGRTSIELEFIGAVSGQERLRARSVLVSISRADGRPKPIVEALRARMEAYQAGDWSLT